MAIKDAFYAEFTSQVFLFYLGWIFQKIIFRTRSLYLSHTLILPLHREIVCIWRKAAKMT